MANFKRRRYKEVENHLAKHLKVLVTHLAGSGGLSLCEKKKEVNNRKKEKRFKNVKQQRKRNMSIQYSSLEIFLV